MDYLADHVCVGAGCKGEQQQVNVSFGPREISDYLPPRKKKKKLQSNIFDLLSATISIKLHLFGEANSSSNFPTMCGI
jgi:hypothetical protein